MFVCPWENDTFPTGNTIWREPAGRCQLAPPAHTQPPAPRVCGGLICAVCGRCQHCRTWHAQPAIAPRPPLEGAAL